MAEKKETINKLGKDLDKIIKDMKKASEDYAKADGEKRPELLTKLKDLTREKAVAKDKLAHAIADAEKDPMLNISEGIPKLASLIPITESAEDADADIERALKAGLGDFKAAFNSLEDEAKEDVAQVDENVIKENLRKKKGELNEAVGPLFIISIIAAAPKIIEILAKGLGKLIKVFKTKVKGQEDVDDPAFIKGVIDFAHKWHKGYVKMIKWMLWATGILAKAKLKKDDPGAEKAAEVIYYVIVFGLMIASGAGAVSAAAKGHQGFAAMEGALAAVKSAEVAEFLGLMGIKGVTGGAV